MESMVKPLKWDEFSSSNRMGFRLFRTPGISWLMISVMNIFIKQFMAQGIVRKLSTAEKDYYEAPFKTIKSRKPLRQFPLEVPIDGQPPDVHEMISNYSQKLQESDLPKLLFSASPGTLITPEDVEWSRQHMKNLKIVDIGEGIHFVQEDNPHLIGEELAKWYQTL